MHVFVINIRELEQDYVKRKNTVIFDQALSEIIYNNDIHKSYIIQYTFSRN